MDINEEIIEVYCARDEPQAQVVHAALVAAGIESRVVGGLLGGAVGEIPPGIASSPAVWVPASQAAAARDVIRDLEAASGPFRVPSWRCPKCNTEVESGFDTCWKCLYCPSAC